MDNLAMVILTNLKNGQVMDDLSDHIRAAVARLEECGGGSAEVTLRLKIVSNDADVSQVKLGGSVTAKLPAKQHGENIFFVADEGGLQLTNPNQPELPFGERKASHA